MRTSSLIRSLFAVAALVLGSICNNAFATGCIGNVQITSDPTNLGNNDVRLALLASFNGANGTVPMPYQYAIGNTSTGKYGVYEISAQYVQSPSGAVTTTPVFGLSSSGTTKSGLPPASSGCPKTDSGSTNGGVPPLDGTGGGPGGFGPTPPSPTPIVGVGPVVGCGSDPRCISQN